MIVIYFLICIVVGYFMGQLFASTTVNNSSRKFIRIDENSYILNGKLYHIKDPFAKEKQILEDKLIFRRYESRRLLREQQSLEDKKLKLNILLNRDPNFKDNIIIEDLIKYKDEYNQYKQSANKLEQEYLLTEDEYLMLKINPIQYYHLNNIIDNPMCVDEIGMYNIFDNDTAKYKKNIYEILSKEFKDKWY